MYATLLLLIEVSFCFLLDFTAVQEVSSDFWIQKWRVTLTKYFVFGYSLIAQYHKVMCLKAELQKPQAAKTHLTKTRNKLLF